MTKRRTKRKEAILRNQVLEMQLDSLGLSALFRKKFNKDKLHIYLPRYLMLNFDNCTGEF